MRGLQVKGGKTLKKHIIRGARDEVLDVLLTEGKAELDALLDEIHQENAESMAVLDTLMERDRAEVEGLLAEINQQNEVFWADYWAKHDADIKVFLAELEVGTP